MLKFRAHFRLLVVLGLENRLENPYMLLWRVVNNIDALRDIYINGEQICIDATSKDARDGYTREWPQQTDCTREVVDSLVERGVVADEPRVFEKFEIFG